MMETIGMMKHHFWTAYANLATGQNFKDWSALITGIGQGTGAGPQMWVAVSTHCLKLLCTQMMGLLLT